jgi:ribonuclease P protein component
MLSLQAFISIKKMNFTYPKASKLKSKKTIDGLFTNGKSVGKYPLRLVYMPCKATEEASKMGVSVSKKYFKKAVDRNYYKRVLREAYRLHKNILAQNETPYFFMLLYQSKDRLTQKEVALKAIALFEKWLETVKTQN